MAFDKKKWDAEYRRTYKAEYRRTHRAECNKYLAEWRKNHRKEVKKWWTKYYSKNKRERAIYLKKYFKKYNLNNPGKTRERNNLKRRLGHSKNIDLLTKKLLAFQRAGRRHKLTPSIINHIQKGETYEAYA